MIDKDQVKEIINDPTKQRIISRLRSNGRSNFGRIIKDLSLSTRDGVTHIVELRNIGVVNYVKNPSQIELNAEFLKIIEE